MTIDGLPVHPSITAETLALAVERRMTSLDNSGFCILCGCEHDGVEPDARNYACESCGAEQVFGADELLLEFLP